MLLRRISQHIKDQNWFAVVLDFGIVVVGVFVGLQVQQWALERERQVSEQAYLMRLHNEVVQLSELRRHYDESRPLVVSNALAALAVLKTTDQTVNLTDFQCRSIIWSSSYYMTTPPYELPTLTELLSAGRLDTISSDLIRTEILSYIQEASRTSDYITANRGSSDHIGSQFPDLFTLGLDRTSDNDVDDFGLQATCNLDLMRSNHEFLNAIAIVDFGLKSHPAG